MTTDSAAERAVLTAAYQSNEGFQEVEDLVDARCFMSDASNALWWQVIKHYYNENPDGRPDIVTLQSIANGLGFTQLADANETKYLYLLENSTVQIQNARKAAAKIRKIRVASDVSSILVQCSKDILNISGDEPLYEILNKADKPLSDYLENLSGGGDPKRFGVGLRDWLVYLKENPRDCIGISTGFPRTDLAWGGGFRDMTINVIASRFGGGKSSLALNMGIHISKTFNFPVLYLDTEMGEEQHWARMMAATSGIPINKIEMGKFATNEEDRLKSAKAMKLIESLPFYYQSIAGQPFEETLSVMRRWVRKVVGSDQNGKTKPCLVIFDYIKLMDEGGLSKLQEYQALGFLMTGLHNFAVKNNIPMLAFAQMNRAGLDDETSAVIAGSDRIGWLCTTLSLWKEKNADEMATQKDGNQKLIVIKSRFGSGTEYGQYINFQFDRPLGLIRELGYSTDIQSGGDGSKPDDGVIF